ncbi:MAG: hypothetical protein ACRD2N_14915 [Vicinamibacterales bacterium]
MTSFRSPGVLKSLAVASALCAVSNPTAIVGREPATCRTVATELTAQVMAAPAFTATITSSCTFNPSLKQSACTSQYSDSQGTKTTSETRSTYHSLADVVDEIAVVPPLVYAVSLSGTQTGNRGQSSSSSTNEFDGNRRIAKTVNKSEGGDSTTTYSAWDAAGRPTRASDVGRGYSNTRSISYDDVARTRTTIVNAGPLRTVETFDADGNQIATIATSGGSALASKTAIMISATQRICKPVLP